MLFKDEVNIKINAGDGGNGKKFFHREKYVRFGGPSGGNGGDGGDIFFMADDGINNLYKFRNNEIYKAENGGDGGKSNRKGKEGRNTIIKVPVGTEVSSSDKKIHLTFHKQIILFAKGGKGGRGNKTFKTSVNKSPNLFENGEKGEFFKINLNLKFISDIGILGLPNVGKSTLITKLTNSEAKIADYEFTTTTPNLGVLKDRNILLVDLPGLIKDASKNKGMGVTFLKHLLKTRLIFHILDGSSDDVLKDYKLLWNELNKYSPKFRKMKEVVGISKIDLISNKVINDIKIKLKDKQLIFFSSTLNKNISTINSVIVREVEKIKKMEDKNFMIEDQKDFLHIKFEKGNTDININIIKKDEGVWEISGEFTDYWLNRIPIYESDNKDRLIKKFKYMGLFEKLKNHKIAEGDLITFKNTNFYFYLF